MYTRVTVDGLGGGFHPPRDIGQQSIEPLIGWVFVGQRPVLTGVVAVHVHLPDIGVAEFAQLQIDDDQAAQAAVEEQQIDTEPAFVDAQPSLSADKGEVAAQLQRELFQSLDQRALKVGLGVFVLEIQKFETVGVLDGFVRGERIAGLGLAALFQHGAFVFRQ